jgi:dTDP-4-dehydrorhamnose 3,5-epimerase-like enzyme
MIIPKELSSYFSKNDFLSYPVIDIPQKFVDSRGIIINLADGIIGDVSFIQSKKDAVRANHYHSEDWHLCYIITGSCEYLWSEDLSNPTIKKLTIESDQLIFTPSMTAHKLVFNEPTKFITISKLSRKKSNYDADTFRLDNFFK